MNDLNELNQESNTKLKFSLHTVQSGYSTVLFTALSKSNWAAIFTQGIGKFLAFPAFVALGFFNWILLMADLIKAKNKNAGKVMQLAVETLSLSLITVGVVGSFFAGTALALLAPILFVTAMAANTLYNLGASIYFAYKGFTAATKEKAKAFFNQAKARAVGFVLGAVTTVGVALMMVFKIAPVAMSIASAVSSGIGLVIGLIGGLKKFFSKKPAAEIQAPLLPALSEKKPTNDYHYSKDRKIAMQHAPDTKTYLVKEIDNKVIELQQSKSRRFFNEDKKREVKIHALNELKEIVQDDSARNISSHSIFKNKSKGVFQSFFRNKSDTQDIFEAAEEYTQKRNAS